MRDRMDPGEFRDLRIAAAHLANESLAISGQPPTMKQAADWQDFWLARITAPQAVAIALALTVTDARGRVKYQFTSDNGGTMTAASFTMDDTCTLAATPEDDHGDPTGDALTFAASDGGAVLTLAASGNTCLLTPVAEGTSTITASDPSSPGVAAWEVDVTVEAGATSSIQGTVTVNTGANAAPPAGG
jgi:hypothetical protein